MNIAKMCIFVRRNVELVEILLFSYNICTFWPMSFWFNIYFSGDTFAERYVKNQEHTYNFK